MRRSSIAAASLRCTAIWSSSPTSSTATAPAEHGRDAATWRVGEIETDARMLFCRVTSDRPVARVALVDGSLVRTAGRRGFHLALPRVVPDLHLDVTADARMAGQAFGA